ncbi:sensor histidine kinase [Paenibacillus mendelii]|uniref:histidine kinase n=1 Tax=Paenibacillus mendelii TaxID=206163 RepID=A0ABV6J859_9BACL|nr:sensor histidine kinase [Paenibacillus mendelii]MCQ6560217.1 sensor histidine kinase [Paenibacillus mendelii]
MMPWRMLGTATFFAAFFISPLLRTKPVLLTINLIFASILAVSVLWPDMDGTVNPYTFLVLSLLAGKAVYRLPVIHACIVGFFLTLGAYAPSLADYPNLPAVYIGLYAVLLTLAFTVYRIVWQQAVDAAARNEALLGEYRKMKRRMASDEELARQEERARVGQDIHDSVGHKLTALMMQLEVFRMQTDAESEVQVRNLRELARESLQETRSAVKALQDHEPGGLPAIMRLIRKLEAESVIKIHFAVKHGALSAPLTNNQSIAVYRVVQEALTNIMKHSRSREAEVMFEAPGGSVFRFEISNPGAAHAPFQEGFGFKSMRERIENNHGRLEVISNHERFIVSGTLPLNLTSSVEETTR